MQYNSVYVDEKYSQVVIDALRTKTFLVPGYSYNPEYATGDVAGGMVQYYSFAAETVDAGNVAADYSSEEPTNALTPVYIANAYRQSKKLYQQTADSISVDYGEQVFRTIAENIREGRDLGALAALSVTASTNATAAVLTTANIESAIEEGWETLQNNSANPGIIVMNPNAFTLLNRVLNGKFAPETNDQLVQAGSLGQYFGMSIFITPQIGRAAVNTAVNIRATSMTASTVSLDKTGFMIYDPKYFAMLQNVTEAAIVPSGGRFAGVLANYETNVGVRLLDAKCGFAWLMT